MEWQPIETAPKDQRILLGFSNPVFTGVSAIFGRWESDKFATKPRPYWTHDMERLTGITGARAKQPTHWMPLPVPPSN